jgi:hypothetical protein
MISGFHQTNQNRQTKAV